MERMVRIGKKLIRMEEFDLIEIHGKSIYMGRFVYDGMNVVKLIFESENIALIVFSNIEKGLHFSIDKRCSIEVYLTLFGVRGIDPWARNSPTSKPACSAPKK